MGTSLPEKEEEEEDKEEEEQEAKEKKDKEEGSGDQSPPVRGKPPLCMLPQPG